MKPSREVSFHRERAENSAGLLAAVSASDLQKLGIGNTTESTRVVAS